MIRVAVFDLDGTLVETEHLKALSYAKAAVELCPRDVHVDEVLEAYKEVVGRSRREVARTLMQRFDLESASEERMAEFEVETPWESFVAVRLSYYDEMVKDPDTLREHQWPHTRALLETMRTNQCGVALATTSQRDQADRVLRALDLEDVFDFTITGDEVERTKPHPEIYRSVALEMQTRPDEILAIEDSPTGIEAARNAGLHCVAVTTQYTQERVHADSDLDERWIVDEPDRLPEVVQSLIDREAN